MNKFLSRLMFVADSLGVVNPVRMFANGHSGRRSDYSPGKPQKLRLNSKKKSNKKSNY